MTAVTEPSWVTSNAADDDLVVGVQNLLLALDVPVTRTSVRDTLVSHPFYPSLGAATQSLTSWGLDAEAFEVEEQLLPQLPLPCIAVLRPESTKEAGPRRERLVVVNEVADDRIRYVDPEEGPLECEPKAFRKDWTGQVVVVEGGDDAGEPDHAARVAEERLARLLRRGRRVLGGLAAAMVGGVALWMLRDQPRELALLGLHLGGSIVCVVLTSHYLDWGEGLLRRVCPSGKKVGCRSVLDSPGARLFGRIPLADLGLLYFVGGVVALVLGSLSGMAESVSGQLAILSILALPLVVYSLAYQAFVIRKWCWLCLVVQAILVAEAALGIGLGVPLASGVADGSWLYLAVSFLVVSAVWSGLRPLIGKDVALSEAKLRYRRLIRHPQVVAGLLSTSREVVPQARLEGDLVLGPPDSAHEILIVTHPSCRYCAAAHREALDLHRRFGDRLTIRFRILGAQSRGRAQELAIHCTALSLEGRSAEACEVLHRWFEQGEAAGPLENDAPLQREDSILEARKALTKISAWSHGNQIYATPSIFVDQMRLGADLELPDLAFFLSTTEDPRGDRPGVAPEAAPELESAPASS